jgi:hypothetical protein
MKYVEQREFTLRLDVRRGFPEDYAGDEDGYAWWADFAPIAAEIVRAAAQIATRHPGWQVRPANRGRPSDEEVTLVVDWAETAPK